MKLCWGCILLALVHAGAVLGDDLTQCNIKDVVAFRDALRLSSCEISRNTTQFQTFRESVYVKHDQSGK